MTHLPVNADACLYDLPSELIAQDPAPRRGDARLLLVARGGGVLGERRVRELPALLGPGDVVILNDSRVLPARLRARRPDGGSVELLLVRATTPDRWLALARPARRLRVGQTLTLAPPPAAASPPGAAPELSVAAVGTAGYVTLAGTDLAAVAEAWGELPLPPYIRRPGADPDGAERRARDRERYQTVFARETGSVAAPTAGLHLEMATLGALRERGVTVGTVTLHVGPGTFRPPGPAELASGRLHAERFACPPGVLAAARRARAGGGLVLAVGTTSLRVLETVQRLGLPADAVSAAGVEVDGERIWPPAGADDGVPDAPLFAGSASRVSGGWHVAGETRLFLRPPDTVGAADALLTNFHLPGSSLLMLVAAMGGDATWRTAYAHAVAERFRFYSYGDAMLLLPSTAAARLGEGG
jgi:S-adenosylmethionine:tRNA ribosyltransferase-isomerase